MADSPDGLKASETDNSERSEIPPPGKEHQRLHAPVLLSFFLLAGESRDAEGGRCDTGTIIV
ncbi:hypothetical protein BO223_08640 [Faecalibaculum rodentium]|uniref:Uncharacterized protein n=1 Tax=Faecalibaculum rodentium TaxID=1702221 RepID=A0A1Q9YIU3_9FIRM|nr:hypothetical protein BO223_08640 [Faecalibaculum rodentium]